VYDFVFKNLSVHAHPKLHIIREIAEMTVYRLAMLEKPELIVDVGGNPIRHGKFGRKNVHSCCPILSPYDAIREHARITAKSQGKRVGDYCGCTVQTCTHLIEEGLGVISVDSLYYVPESDWLEVVCRSGIAFAAIHDFTMPCGDLLGEGGFVLRADGNVVMKSSGNADYVHSACLWVLGSQYYEKDGKAMTWSLVETVGVMKVYKFITCPIFPQIPRDIVAGDWLRSCDYGSIPQQSLSDDSFFVTRGYLSAVAVGDYIVANSDTENVVLSKAIVLYSERMCMRQVRDQKLYQTILNGVMKQDSIINKSKTSDFACSLDISILYGMFRNAEWEERTGRDIIRPCVEAQRYHSSPWFGLSWFQRSLFRTRRFLGRCGTFVLDYRFGIVGASVYGMALRLGSVKLVGKFSGY